MATAPKKVDAVSVNKELINGMINQSPAMQAMGVPYADGSTQNLHEIGSIITKYQSTINEFLGMITRLANVVVSSKLYRNNLGPLKAGYFEYGETIEDVYVTLAKPYKFDVDRASKEVFKIEKPDVRTAFYYQNYKEVYPMTISDMEMRTAFLSYQGMADIISRIIQQMYTSAAYDEQQVMYYTLFRWILNNNMKQIQIPTVSNTNMNDIVSTVKGTTNKMSLMKTDYNPAGVPNFSNPEDQVIIISADFDAKMDVEVLASAFNLPYANFLQQRYLVDEFGMMDKDRLKLIFTDYPSGTYTEITDAEIATLKKIPLCVIDKSFFKVYDNQERFFNNFNGLGGYDNNFYHLWKTFAISPFAPAAYFTETANEPVTPPSGT